MFLCKAAPNNHHMTDGPRGGEEISGTFLDVYQHTPTSSWLICKISKAEKSDPGILLKRKLKLSTFWA
jgi:hypothetical protein